MDEHVYHIPRIGVHFTYEINILGSVWMNKCITRIGVQCKRLYLLAFWTLTDDLKLSGGGPPGDLARRSRGRRFASMFIK